MEDILTVRKKHTNPICRKKLDKFKKSYNDLKVAIGPATIESYTDVGVPM